MAKENYSKSSTILAMDMIVSVVSSLLAILLIRFLSQPIFQFTHYVISWTLFSAAGSALGLLAVKNYRVILRHSTIRNISKIARAILYKEALLLICVLTDLFSIGDINGAYLLVLLDALLSFSGLVLIRVMVISIIDSKSESVEMNVERMSVMVFGTTDKSVSLLPRLEFSPRYNVIGFITDNEIMKGKILTDKKIYTCTTEEEFNDLYTTLGSIDCILFALPEEEEQQEQKLVRWSIKKGVHVLLAPKVEEVEFQGMSKELTGRISKEMDYIPDGMSSFERNVKRAVDCALSGLLIVVFSPLMLICHIAIKLDDGGPSIFKQERIGRFGRPFNILKFRTMRTDAESAGPALYSGDDDPRLTKVGKFLRKHHLDELPQLFNVFKGEMAFIGYRPERRYYIDQIMKKDPRYYYLYQIRPGVTSYATLHNGYTDTLDKMVRRLHYDLYYLKNRSWWFDMKVLWQTFRSIMFGKKF